MANKTPPAHDFAPAWLKIPTYDTFKPSGASSERSGHTSRRDEHSFSYTRNNRDNDVPASHQPHYSDCRKDNNVASRERKNSYMPSYHHSIDFDDSYSSLHNPHYYDNGYNGSSCNNQAVLSRRPHSRHDFRISVSYAKAENLAKHMTNSGGYYGHKGKGKHHDSSCHSNNGVTDVRGMGVSSNYFNQEFPSLQGDITEEPTTPPALNGSAWEKPRNINVHNAGMSKKIQLVKKLSKTDLSCDSSKKSQASSSCGLVTTSGSVYSNSISSSPHTVIITPIAKGGSSTYRALIPAKSTLPKKSIPTTTREGLKVTNKKSSPTPPPSTHSMEILVKHPKAPGNKSEFLKTLRNEKKELEEREYADKNCISNREHSLQSLSEEHHVNGIEISKLSFNDDDKSVLSSSLEAEERLLREMGWKEEVSDDENYAPLTEDEMREFRDRSENIMKKNGVRRNLLANLSPLRLAPFPAVPPPTENASSSSESDSDF